MALEFNDGRVTGSSGVAKAGLTLGIIGTGLAALAGGNGLGGILGGGKTAVELENAQLRAEKYTDGATFDLYQQIVATQNIAAAQNNALQAQLYNFMIDTEKKTALNEQAQKLNREYDNTVRDYMMTIINNKIDCCQEKVNMQIGFNKELNELTAASIISWVNGSFIPGVLKLPASNISPNVQLA